MAVHTLGKEKVVWWPLDKGRRAGLTRGQERSFLHGPLWTVLGQGATGFPASSPWGKHYHGLLVEVLGERPHLVELLPLEGRPIPDLGTTAAAVGVLVRSPVLGVVVGDPEGLALLLQLVLVMVSGDVRAVSQGSRLLVGVATVGSRAT